MLNSDAGVTPVQLMLSRRSTRDFVPGAVVSDAQLHQVLACGLSAPSSKNAQPWRLHVVADPQGRIRIAEAMRNADSVGNFVPHDPETNAPAAAYVSTVRESADVLERCSTAVFLENRGLFSGGRRRLAQGVGRLLIGHGLEMIGIGAAVENMLLAADSLGLAAAFMGDVTIAEDFIGSLLGMSGDVVGVVAMGQPVDRLPARSMPDPATHELVVWHDLQ